MSHTSTTVPGRSTQWTIRSIQISLGCATSFGNNTRLKCMSLLPLFRHHHKQARVEQACACAHRCAQSEFSCGHPASPIRKHTQVHTYAVCAFATHTVGRARATVTLTAPPGTGVRGHARWCANNGTNAQLKSPIKTHQPLQKMGHRKRATQPVKFWDLVLEQQRRFT